MSRGIFRTARLRELYGSLFLSRLDDGDRSTALGNDFILHRIPPTRPHVTPRRRIDIGFWIHYAEAEQRPTSMKNVHRKSPTRTVACEFENSTYQAYRLRLWRGDAMRA
jgi:hypothetical protein